MKVHPAFALTVSGLATFYLTTDGTPTGPAIFTNIDTQRGIFKSHDEADIAIQSEFQSLSDDKKVLVFKVNQITNVLLGALNIVSAANGRPINILVIGE